MMQTNTLLRLIGPLLLGFMLSLTVAAQTVTYFHNDISGTPLLATDASGAVVWKETYRPYGDKLLRQPASAGNKIGYHGKPHDEHTGLSYAGARYYDPALGRFMGVDPVRFQEDNLHSFNRYAYANNNPYKYVDPDGRYAELAFEAFSLALGVDSFQRNFGAGNYGAALVDGVGVAGDAVLAAVPGAPGVIGLTIRGTREGVEQAAKGAGNAFKDFNQARNAAVQWLEGHGFKAERPTLGKFGDNAGKPIGMKSADGKSGFRVEFDERHGAHINVWSGRQKDTFTFEGNRSAVDQIVKQFVRERP
jgi:RHS repeat-associated protein